MVLFKDKMTPVSNFTTRFFAATILLYPLVAVFAPKGMVALLALPVLLFLFAERNRTAVFGALPRIVLALLAVLAVWSLVTIWWSPRPLDSLELWLRVVGIGLCGMVMLATAAKATAAERRFLIAAFIASGWFFVALFAFELFTDGVLSRLAISLWNLLTPWDSGPPRSMLLLLQASAALAVFAWPCMLAIRRRGSKTIAALFGIAVGALLLVQNMEASLVAFAGGMAAYAAVHLNWRLAIVAILVGLALINVVVVLAALEMWSMEQPDEAFSFLSGGVIERLHIIDYVYVKINENPWIGWGFDASRAIGQDVIYGVSNTAIPLHPHNIWIQTWLELGLVGLVAVIALVAAVLIRIAAGGQNRVVMAASIAAVTAYLLIGNISYGMWQNWWLAIAWLNAAFLAVTAVADGADDP